VSSAASTPISSNTLRNANFANLTTITDAAAVPRSFLATEADFQFIKGLHSANKIVTLVGDFGGPAALRNVGDWLRGHGTVVSAFYTSNVEQYLFNPPAKWQSFYRSVGSMPLDSASLFIRPTTAGTTGSATAAPLSAELWAARQQAVIAFYGPATAPGVLPRPAPTPPTRPTPIPATTVQPPLSGAVTGTAFVTVVQDSTRGSLRGVLRDTSGVPWERVAVVVDGYSLSATTASDGSYVIPNVPAGVYAISGRRIGYTTVLVNNVRVSAGQITVVDMRMHSAAVTFSGVVGASVAGNFTVVQTGRGNMQLCPIFPFLDAVNSGRVGLYAHATACVR
jgi:hypothetical protein